MQKSCITANQSSCLNFPAHNHKNPKIPRKNFWPRITRLSLTETFKLLAAISCPKSAVQCSFDFALTLSYRFLMLSRPNISLLLLIMVALTTTTALKWIGRQLQKRLTKKTEASNATRPSTVMLPNPLGLVLLNFSGSKLNGVIEFCMPRLSLRHYIWARGEKICREMTNVIWFTSISTYHICTVISTGNAATTNIKVTVLTISRNPGVSQQFHAVKAAWESVQARTKANVQKKKKDNCFKQYLTSASTTSGLGCCYSPRRHKDGNTLARAEVSCHLQSLIQSHAQE